MAWRDRVASNAGRRQADYAWTVLARVLSWARGSRAHRCQSLCERGGRLYRAARVRENLDRCG